MKKFKKYGEKLFGWKYFNHLVLGILFLISLLLRAYLIDKNLFFGPEQGRDMLVVRDLVINHKLVLIGPTTAVEGVFHGPLYYYLAAIPFTMSNGNPLFIELFFIFLNSLSVFFIYFLGKELFSKRIGFLASIIFTFSFSAIVIARWLSHPPLIIPISCLFFLFLTRFIKGKNIYLIPTAIMYGLATQSEFSNFVIFSFIIFLVVVIFWRRLIKQKLINLITALFLVVFLPTFNFILFDLRHNFLITRSLLKSQVHRPDFLGYIFHTLSGSFLQFFKVFSDTLVPLNILGGVLIFIASLYCLLRLSKKNRNQIYIVLIWLFSPFLAFILLRYNPLYHYFTATITGIIILAAILIDYIFSLRKALGSLVLILLIFVNLLAVYIFLPDNRNVFFQSTQPQLKYSDQLAVIDRIYKDASGKPFFFQAYTIPYWLQEGWQYLFWYYGKNKYGYLPVHTDKGTLYVIIQDDPSGLLFQHNWHRITVLNWGERVERFRYGALTVEKLIVK